MTTATDPGGPSTDILLKCFVFEKAAGHNVVVDYTKVVVEYGAGSFYYQDLP